MAQKRNRQRANGEGWILKRKDGRYDVGLSYLTPNGIERARTTKRKRKDADAWLTEQKARRGLGLAFDAAKLSFADYLERWLETGVKGSVKEGSYLTHRSNVRRHLIPSVGSVRLAKLTAAHFQGLYGAKLAEGLSARTVLGIHATARKALRQAERWDLVQKNAAANAKPPSPKQAEVIPLSEGQRRAFLEIARGEPFEAMYVLALATGARHGELLALTWDDVVFSETGAEVSIRRTYSRAMPKREGGESFAIGTTKTGRGRTVSVGPKAANALREHKRRQSEDRLAFGGDYKDEGRIFCRRDGGPLTQRESSRRFSVLRERAGIPKTFRFHALRHTFATMHLSSGTPAKVVQEALGHATIAQTMNVYSHVLPNMQRDAAARLDALL